MMTSFRVMVGMMAPSLPLSSDRLRPAGSIFMHETEVTICLCQIQKMGKTAERAESLSPPSCPWPWRQFGADCYSRRKNCIVHTLVETEMLEISKLNCI
jgi:hypothetical protein